MKNLPKIIKGVKGHEDLTVDFSFRHINLVLEDDKDVIRFREMLVSVFNAGKNGIVDPDLAANFEEFYKLYPRSKSPKAALKAYSTARKDVAHETIMDGLRAQLPEMMVVYNTDKTKVKHPSSWLNAGCWDDETEDKPPLSHQTMSDAEIFSTECGQRALKRGYGYALKCFVAQYGRLPDKDEGKAIVGKPLNNSKFMKDESKKLNHYLKDK